MIESCYERKKEREGERSCVGVIKKQVDIIRRDEGENSHITPMRQVLQEKQGETVEGGAVVQGFEREKEVVESGKEKWDEYMCDGEEGELLQEVGAEKKSIEGVGREVQEEGVEEVLHSGRKLKGAWKRRVREKGKGSSLTEGGVLTKRVLREEVVEEKMVESCKKARANIHGEVIGNMSLLVEAAKQLYQSSRES